MSKIERNILLGIAFSQKTNTEAKEFIENCSEKQSVSMCKYNAYQLYCEESNESINN